MSAGSRGIGRVSSQTRLFASRSPPSASVAKLRLRSGRRNGRKTEKTKFFEAVWNLWNWDDVSARYAAARKMNLLVPETVEQTATR